MSEVTMSEDTFMGLLAPNLRPLRKLLQARFRIPDQADDILQEALLHAFVRRDQLRLRSKFKSWLLTIVLNEMRTFFRLERGIMSLDEFPEIDPSDRAPSPLARFEQVERREWLHAGLAKLSTRDRAAIRLRDLDGLNMTETAEALAISKAAAKATHFRARKRLAYALSGANRPVAIEGCRAPDRSGKQSGRNTTSGTISVDSERIESTSERNRNECLPT
jgi:RNA polymerase sigma-70 factor (ECF subfamily)